MDQPVRRAKERVLAQIGEATWCAGIGVARIDSALGLVVSVEPGARARAEAALSRLKLDVPVEVREVGPIRAR